LFKKVVRLEVCYRLYWSFWWLWECLYPIRASRR